jgi:hypothetical protein
VRVLLVLILVGLGACHQPPPPRADWIIHSQLVFLADDRVTQLPPPHSKFRLFFPYIAGDLYGPPTTGDFLSPTLQPDYHFDIDLNRNHQALLKSLEPTDFSVSYLRIEPADARMARLAPAVLQADGIEPVGRTEWIDGDSRKPVMLLYFDRPAAIVGGGKYSIHTSTAGYVWVGQVGDTYTVVPTPARLLLAVILVTSLLQ